MYTVCPKMGLHWSTWLQRHIAASDSQSSFCPCQSCQVQMRGNGLKELRKMCQHQAITPSRHQLLPTQQETSQPVDVLGFGDRFFDGELARQRREVAVPHLDLNRVRRQESLAILASNLFARITRNRFVAVLGFIAIACAAVEACTIFVLTDPNRALPSSSGRRTVGCWSRRPARVEGSAMDTERSTRCCRELPRSAWPTAPTY